MVLKVILLKHLKDTLLLLLLQDVIISHFEGMIEIIVHLENTEFSETGRKSCLLQVETLIRDPHGSGELDTGHDRKSLCFTVHVVYCS